MTKLKLGSKPIVDALRNKDTGRLLSALATVELRPPDMLELAGDDLVYIHHTSGRYEPSGVHPDGEMLMAFCALAEASPVRILKFARKWGVLGVCSHGRAYHHLPPPGCVPRKFPESGADAPASQKQRRSRSAHLFGAYCEPLLLWHSRAKTCALLLETADAIKRGAVVDNLLTRRFQKLSGPLKLDVQESQRLAVSEGVNMMMIEAGVVPTLQFTEVGFDFFLGYDGLAGAVATTLFSAVASRSFGLCAGCGRVHEPAKRTRDGASQWCEKCRRSGHPVAAAQKALRLRVSKVWKLHDEGMTTEAIAKAVDRSAEQVEKWIGSRRSRK